jgi:hypothetical protein
VVFFVACGGDDGPCDPNANTGCEDGQVCEVVTGGEPKCFAPVVVRGDVFDMETEADIAGARVVALDVNGSPRSSVATTNTAGDYELAIPSERNADGVPVAVFLTLRVDASGYLSFPAGIRPALPIDTAVAVKDGERYVVDTALTSVGLIGLDPGAGAASLAGSVDVAPSPNGVLVVAENTTGAGFSAIADTDGDYKIFNLPAGDYTVRAYSIDANYTPGTITLADAQEATLDLALSGVVASTVTGTVDLVEGATPTSVIMVVASTFNATIGRGESPPGMRAPLPGILPDITGPWTIAGVPEGRYVVLAAFENDGSVRDQSNIGGTALVYADVVAGQELAIPTLFKVTLAIPLVGPGATAAEAVTAAPTLSWTRDPSAMDYRVQVFDARGSVVMDERTGSGATSSMAYGGPLDPGMYYQVRVTSYDNATPTPHALANTEDLKGLFYVPAAP